MGRKSDKPEQILRFVNEFVQENGYAPSVREIGEAVGLRSTATVTYHLRQLQEKGLLQSTGQKGMKRAVIPMVRRGQIPVIGVVTAGMPILAFENQEGTMAWDGDPGCFALRVRGDSMINARIFDGDIVYIRQQDTVDNGEIAAVLIDNEATLKRVRLFDDHISLEPENPMYKPLVYWNEAMNDIRILGKAVAFTSAVR